MSEVSTAPIARNPLFRSQNKIRMVRVEHRRDGSEIVVDAHLPIGRGYGTGTILDYQNLGWESYETYTARKHSEEVELKRLEAQDLTTDEEMEEMGGVKLADGTIKYTFTGKPEAKPESKKVEKKGEGKK